MKRNLISSLTLGVVALMLVACSGGKGDNSEAGKSSAKTSKVSTSRHVHEYDTTKWEHDEETHWHPATCGHDVRGDEAEHEFVKDTTLSVDATCAKAGKLVEKCACGATRETVIPADANHHTWGTASKTVAKSDTTSQYEIKECTTCHSIALAVKANSYLTIDGSLKSVPEGDTTIKLSKNGNYVTYTFELDQAFQNAQVYLYGWIDYFEDGQNNNHLKGHKVNGADTFELKVGDTAVEVTDERTFVDMGMTNSGEDDGSGHNRGTFTMCPLGGTASLATGSNTITYTRKGSYNLNVEAFYFIVAGK